jgi:hypothetical protein
LESKYQLEAAAKMTLSSAGFIYNHGGQGHYVYACKAHVNCANGLLLRVSQGSPLLVTLL